MKLEERVLLLLGQNVELSKIVKQVGLSKHIILDISKRNSNKIGKLKQPKVLSDKKLAIKKIEDKVRKMVDDGLTYPEINKKLKIHNAGRIGRRIGITINDRDSEKWIKIVKEIEKDIKKGLPYNELKIKYDFEKKGGKYYNYGLKRVAARYRDIRDKEITKQYKDNIARVVLTSDVPEMNSPERLTNVLGIYRSSSRNGFRKYPNIERGKSGLFVEGEVIKIIKKGRTAKKQKTYQEISDILNAKGFVSPMGNPYNYAMVSFKWAKIKKLKL